jgi:YfiH family protein
MSAWLEAGWPAPPGVRAGVTLRHGLGVSRPPFDSFNLGARCGDADEAVAENRRQLRTALAFPSAPRWLRQVHGVGVVRFGASPTPIRTPASPGGTEADCGEPEADAAVTAEPGTVLAILTADCLPVVLAARDGREVGAAHAGWRGLCAGVLEATVAAMRPPPGDLVAWLGPAAGPSHYEVGAEVLDAFAARDGRARLAFLPTRPGHWRVDLPMLARQRLLDAGVFAVHGGGLCTIADAARFYSHRRSTLDGQGGSGRMATLAWIAPPPV